MVIELPILTIAPQKCYKDHVFYPKIKNGVIIPFTRCPVRSCRVFLSAHPRINKMRRVVIQRKQRTTTPHYCYKGHEFYPFLDAKGEIISLKRCPVNGCRVLLGTHPLCKICNIVLYDQKNLIQHNKRLHPVLVVV